MARRGPAGRLLTACGGDTLPSGDTDLWLTLAAGVVSPAGEALETEGTGELDEVSRAVAALCALEHVDWLGAMSALWSALGATDPAGRLTPLGWWGLPEALLTVWAD